MLSFVIFGNPSTRNKWFSRSLWLFNLR